MQLPLWKRRLTSLLFGRTHLANFTLAALETSLGWLLQ
jgi:hypothetical protein